MNGFILLSSAQMRAAEKAAIENGVASAALMEAAGRQTAQIAMKTWSKRPVAVLCGPGNNGGDGFVAAREIAAAGWPVRVGLLGHRTWLKGDAKLMAELYEGDVLPLDSVLQQETGLIIDALFGTGLSRPIEGEAAAVIEAVNAHPAPVLAADLPSGVNADTGAIMGAVIRAARTVTFFCKKPGHVLYPGRGLSGAVDVVDIGITPESAGKVPVDTYENHPALWGRFFLRPSPMGHKYHRGSVFAVSGGPSQTGAARLAARGALRMGAGLVSVLSPREALQVNAAHLTAIMVKPADSGKEILSAVEHVGQYAACVVAGPAMGIGEATREKILTVLKSNAGAVLDADALTSFSQNAEELFSSLRPDDVLTPHTGEFAQLFPDINLADGKLAAARRASKRAGCVIVLKGGDTVIAASDGRAAVNVNAPPHLATAGAGDVLAGFIAGLRAQGMPGFEAACAGVWLHGACGQVAGPGLIAEDLPEAAPVVLRSFFQPNNTQNDNHEEKGASRG